MYRAHSSLPLLTIMNIKLEIHACSKPLACIFQTLIYRQVLRNTEWFSVQDSVIHARGMLRDIRKA
jgi:hypothetical protein